MATGQPDHEAHAGNSGEKSGRAFRTIGEVSETLDLPQHVLRFWETRFNQIRPLKRGGNRRYYRPEDVELLLAIKTMLHEDGLTIKGVQKRFREQGVRTTVAEVLDHESPAQRAQSPQTATRQEGRGEEGELLVRPAPARAPIPDPRAPALKDILDELKALRRMLD